MSAVYFPDLRYFAAMIKRSNVWIGLFALLILTACGEAEVETDPHAGHDHEHDHATEDVLAQLDAQIGDRTDPTTLDYETLVEVGREALNQGDFNNASTSFGHALDKDSTRVEAWYGLAFALSEQRGYDLAVHYFNRAASIDSTYRYTLSNRGLCKIRNPRNPDPIGGIADLDLAIEMQPECGMCYLNRAYGFQALDQPEKACEDLTKAIALGQPEAQGLFDNLCGAEAGQTAAAN